MYVCIYIYIYVCVLYVMHDGMYVCNMNVYMQSNVMCCVEVWRVIMRCVYPRMRACAYIFVQCACDACIYVSSCACMWQIHVCVHVMDAMVCVCWCSCMQCSHQSSRVVVWRRVCIYVCACFVICACGACMQARIS